MKKKLLLSLLVVVLVVSLVVACFAGCDKNSGNNTVAEKTAAQLQLENKDVEMDLEAYQTLSRSIYDANLKAYEDGVAAAKAATNVSERYALMAIAEAKLLESAVFVPVSSNGGNYAIGRVAPNTASPVLYGNDSYRYHNVVIADKPITSEERAEMKAHYNEVKGEGTYEAWAKEYLTNKGYTIRDEYRLGYSSDPQTWDVFNTYRSADSEAIVNTYDGLLEYDEENILQPAMATGYNVSDDGLVYTFSIREDTKWVDYEGKVVDDFTADSFVAGFQHLLDQKGGLEYLVDGLVVNAGEYISGEVTDFSQVGIKAVDTYTLEFTLCQPTSYFITMLGYNPFAPMSRAYYESKGGKFGAEFDDSAADYTYGKTYDAIAYCGPYTVTSFTSENTIVFEANPEYWNKDGINIKKITWLFNDGKDATKAYNDMVADVLDASGLNSEALALAKSQTSIDGKNNNFETYHYTTATDATSFGIFMNLNRGGYYNVNDNTTVVSSLTVSQAENANKAMKNVHFRRAIAFALGRANYNGQTVGDELKLVSLINSYVPGNFVALEEDVTVKINGTNRTFEAGTYYGEILQAQIDADGVKIKAWDPEAEEGAGSSAGFDGWYNVDNAVEELNVAIAELEKEGLTISASNPIVLDLPTYTGSSVYQLRANALKQSIETNLGGKVKINLTECAKAAAWYYAGYYCEYGYQDNYNLYDVSGWGPDYGDPATYLNTLLSETGDMIHCLGIY